MTRGNPLAVRLYFDPVLVEVARAVGYVGCRSRELAGRLRDAAGQYGARRLSAALGEVTARSGGRVQLQVLVRRLCAGLLGPPPEQWDEYYRHPDGTPKRRPPGREHPPEPVSDEADPLMRALNALTTLELEARLRVARQTGADAAEVLAVESELLWRGIDLPPAAPAAPTLRKRKRKTD